MNMAGILMIDVGKNGWMDKQIDEGMKGWMDGQMVNFRSEQES